MTDSGKVSIPEFPKNSLGLKRGTVLESTDEITRQIGIEVGGRIVLGYDGKYVRCQGAAWSIERIQDEILDGYWKIIGEIDLSDEEMSKKFAREIELLPI